MAEAVIIATPADIPVERREKDYDWFVEVGDRNTNADLGEYLALRQGGNEETQVRMKDRYDHPHDVWRVPYSLVCKMHESRKRNSDIKFSIFFRRKNSDGAITEFQFKKGADTVVKKAIRTQQARRGGRRL